MKRNVLVICFSELHKDPRVLRQVEALKGEYNITTGGYTQTGQEDCFVKFEEPGPRNAHWRYPVLIRKVVSAYLRLKNVFLPLFGSKQYEIAYWTKRNRFVVRQLLESKADVIIANDLNILPIACSVAKKLNCKLIFDAHEYYPLEFENNKAWLKNVKPLYDYLCLVYFSKVDIFTVVSETIGKEYQREFNLKSFLVIDNAANFYELIPGLVNSDKIKIVHHGFAIPERKIENLINILDNLDSRFELHLILVYNETTENYYRELLMDNSENERVIFHDPVPFKSIPIFLNQFDVGIFFWDEANFSTHATIPNKFYEFLQARLMVAINPSPELEKIINKYNLGIYTKEYNYLEMSRKLNQCTAEDIRRFKENAHRYARELSSQKNKDKIRDIVGKLLEDEG